ncbi:putative transcription factor C2H2 family [Helianthus annuus]|nr:putative transcription factor C2H2 family [Helianthus annuus]KAJ0813747.1 putative transcription factor C2H2 family [Helianthus annuus]
MEQYSQEIMDVNNIVKEKKTSSNVIEYENGGFDCSICLDSVQEPMVTLCGHLYCYPCIYKWIHQQNTSLDIPNKNNPQCPVCKRDISQKTLIPLYGRGQTAKSQIEKKCLDHLGMIQRRPHSPSCGTRVVPTQQTQGFITVPDVINPTSPTMGMLGEMLYVSLLGNMQASLYAYPNSYNLVPVSTRRARRHAMQADRSLGRICFFLFCCMMMCLILF